MILSDRDIRSRVASGSLVIAPFDERNVQPASYEVTLGDQFMAFSLAFDRTLDPDQRSLRERDMHTELGGYVLWSAGFVLATTIERVEIPADLSCQVHGKSTLARLGLTVHQTGGVVDPGFKGTITLELFNANHRPIRLRPGMKIGQLVFAQLSSPAERPYGSPGLGSHYQGQMGVQPARAGEGA